MALMLYLPEREGPGARLLAIIETVLPPRKMEIYDSIQTLSERLHKPLFDVKVAVLLASTRGDLAALLKVGDFIWNLRIIMILPDSDPETITRAHMLRPRYIAWTNDDFSNVGIMVKRLLDLHDRPVSEGTEKYNDYESIGGIEP